MTSKSDTRIVLPPIPAKRYFTIGEVGELCGVKPHVLRYWEQEFTQLRPMKRRGNRRYYQHHEVLLIRRIRELLYEEGFTISGARNRLGEAQGFSRARAAGGAVEDAATEEMPGQAGQATGFTSAGMEVGTEAMGNAAQGSLAGSRASGTAQAGVSGTAQTHDFGTAVDLSALRADLEQALSLLR